MAAAGAAAVAVAAVARSSAEQYNVTAGFLLRKGKHKTLLLPMFIEDSDIKALSIALVDTDAG